MKKFLFRTAVLATLTILSTTAFARPAMRHESGPCSPGAVSSTWSSTILYNDNGRPMSASGIGCDGVAWSQNFLVGGANGGGSTDTLVTSATLSDASTVRITCNMAVTARIVNLQTGNWATSQTTTASQEFFLDISSLPTGVYGVMVYDSHNSPADLSNTFYK